MRPARGGLIRIQWALGGLLLSVLALWLASAPFGAGGVGVFAWRAPSLQGTGTLAMAAMSGAMLLATRPVVLEPWLGGLDKMYRLHKWLGISALVFAVSHWLWVEAPKWLAELGLLTRPARDVAVPPDASQAPLRTLLHTLREPAEGLGEWAFYALVLLVGLAVWKRFPYRRFFQTHQWLPGVYLVLVFHAVVLTDDGSWSQPVGVAMALLMTAGTVAAFVVMFGAVGRGRQAVAEVAAIRVPAGADVLQVDVRLKSRWAGHDAGQFAFVRFDAAEGAHPFTITSPWTGDGHLVFLIKGLGDYTRRLPSLLRVGDLLRVEGPYGTFNFAGDKRRQVWVGGGIGITPFIARLQHLALCPDGKAIDLFYTTATARDGAVARLTAAAQAAGARLHVLVDAVDGRLDAERLCAAVPGWRSADVWFCGPAGFGQALRQALLAKGLPRQDFHQELFNLR